MNEMNDDSIDSGNRYWLSDNDLKLRNCSRRGDGLDGFHEFGEKRPFPGEEDKKDG